MASAIPFRVHTSIIPNIPQAYMPPLYRRARKLFKGGSQSGRGRLSTRSDRRVSVHSDWLCFPGCALGTDVCHWMFKTKVNMVQGQEDGPLTLTPLSGVFIKPEGSFPCVAQSH